jgi:hypothetical protein
LSWTIGELAVAITTIGAITAINKFYSEYMLPHVNSSASVRYAKDIIKKYHHLWAEYLHMAGDVHQNPGPPTKFEDFRFMHWKVNSLPNLIFLRMPLIQAYNSIYKCHVMAISESALTNDMPNEKIDIPGYTPIRCDLMEGDDHGGVLLYYKNDLSAVQRKDLGAPSYTLVLELSIYSKKVFFVHSYRKYGQNENAYEEYYDKFDKMMALINQSTPYCNIVVGDFNAHHSYWHQDHPALESPTDKHGIFMQNIFGKHNLEQIVNQPTYTTNNHSTLLDLVATNQPNLVMENEVHPSLYLPCHHHINFVRFNLKCIVPDPTSRYVWHYNRADEGSLQRSLYQFDWQLNLENKHPNEQLELFNECVMNTAKNFVPGEDKIFYPKDPPWLTVACKNLYKKYRRKFKSFTRRGCPQPEKAYIDGLKQEYADVVHKEKEKYMKALGSAVSDPRTGQKKYWTALKKLMNN